MAIKVGGGNKPTSVTGGQRSTVAWEKAIAEVRQRTVLMELYGDTGTGRTTFALTAPGPIALIHASEKIEGIVQPAVRAGKDIRMVDYGGVFTGSDDAVAKLAGEKWDLLKAAWYEALFGGWARTVVLDTHTEAWELIRLAYFGALKPSGGRVDANYGPVNADWRSLFKGARQQSNVNAIVIGQTKDEYTAKAAKLAAGGITKKSDGMGERTGNTIRAGQKEIPFMCDVVVRTYKNIMSGEGFSSVIEKGWYNAGVEGVPLYNDMSTFAAVMALITDLDEGEWQ